MFINLNITFIFVNMFKNFFFFNIKLLLKNIISFFIFFLYSLIYYIKKQILLH